MSKLQINIKTSNQKQKDAVDAYADSAGYQELILNADGTTSPNPISRADFGARKLCETLCAPYLAQIRAEKIAQLDDETGAEI